LATPKWQPGKLYAPGALVVPRTTPPEVPSTLTNAGFETGDATGWTFDPGFAIATGNPDTGVYCCDQDGGDGVVADIFIIHDPYPVNTAGVMVTGTCRYAQGAAPSGFNPGQVLLRWYDSAMAQIGDDVLGSLVTSGNNGAYSTSTVTSAAPPGAAFVSIGGKVHRNAHRSSSFDNFAWNLDASAIEGLMYKAVQPAIGTSSDVEPVWPSALGVQVIDNEVIWEAVALTRLVWQARPILRSGAVEPTWPTVVGQRVGDNTIAWEATSRRVEDENCPNTKVVIIMASKVFAVDGDIIRFSATANPLDWTTEQDAGYLPSGLQSANSNDMAVLQQYRGNLVAFNASSFQNWQADPDPAAMALLDQMEGIGSTWPKAAQPVANELLFLSQKGFRSVGIAAGAENLAAGDVGEPVDDLVRAAAAFIGVGGKVVSTYYPGAGQFWGCFPANGAGETWAYVYTMSGRKGNWSRYFFPYAIECFAQLGDDLYIRHGNAISRVDEDAVSDEVAGVGVDFTGTVWWPWLDFGQPGVTKMLEGFDYIGTGQGPSIQIGYDQRNVSVMTPAYQLDNDTLPGGIIPLPVSAPTLSVKLTFAGGASWRVNAVNLSFFDLGNGP